MPYPEGLPIHTIWDEIAYLLESTKDLLSLALTCRTFKDLIIPDHLEYRYIHCTLRRGDVWTFLAKRPRLGKGIRSVKLLHVRAEDTLLPQAFTNISDRSLDPWPWQNSAKNLVLFRDALSHMTSLKEFAWKHCFGVDTYAQGEELFDISRVLTNTTHCLEVLSVDFGLVSLIGPRRLLESLSIWTLTGLRKVNIDSPCAAAIHMALDLCPDIEDLHLSGNKSDTLSIFHVMQRGHWKKLRRVYLHLTDGIINASPDMDKAAIITSFLDRHVNLEVIYLQLWESSVPSQPASRLPKLRSIGSPAYGHGRLPIYLSGDIISRLVHWHCPIKNFDIDTLPQMVDLESACLSINDFPLDPFVPFLLKAPNLKRICFGLGEEVDALEYHVHQELLDILHKHSHRLTHIFCDYSLDGITQDGYLYRKLDASFKRSSALRSLTYFRIFTDDGRMVSVRLERDEKGMYSGYQPVNLEEAGGERQNWGNLFPDF